MKIAHGEITRVTSPENTEGDRFCSGSFRDIHQVMGPPPAAFESSAGTLGSPDNHCLMRNGRLLVSPEAQVPHRCGAEEWGSTACPQQCYGNVS